MQAPWGCSGPVRVVIAPHLVCKNSRNDKYQCSLQTQQHVGYRGRTTPKSEQEDEQAMSENISTVIVDTGKGKRLARKGSFKKHFRNNWQLYVFMLIPVIYYIIFRYIPMIGNIIAFRRYRAGSSILGDEWSGLKYFKMFWTDKAFWRAVSR